ncbi:hypothetical protein DYBT9623_04603 [Dyadobacter sp. CECT 9623]|uniref:Uncharacterized protein n=1 Tax=Dyadobacter linearis TaxID=2823330 RepID=A0ABN7RGD4_9BACT|nr:hypothetical protein DYBT9623_04603 [Dyadobacter sp. CECT 9623]
MEITARLITKNKGQKRSKESLYLSSIITHVSDILRKVKVLTVAFSIK